MTELETSSARTTIAVGRSRFALLLSLARAGDGIDQPKNMMGRPKWPCGGPIVTIARMAPIAINPPWSRQPVVLARDQQY
jgi:hypothetical protein